MLPSKKKIKKLMSLLGCLSREEITWYWEKPLSSLHRGAQIKMYKNKFLSVKGKEITITEQSLCTGYLTVKCLGELL